MEISIEDDKSEAVMTLCIGTYPGGCDIYNNEPLGGESTNIYDVCILSLFSSCFQGFKIIFIISLDGDCIHNLSTHVGSYVLRLDMKL